MYFIVEHKEDYTEAGMRRTLPGRIGTQQKNLREKAAPRTKVRRTLPPGAGFYWEIKFTGGYMLDKISTKFHAWAKGWLVLILVALDMFFMAFVMPVTGALMKSGTGLEQPLDLMFFSTPNKLFAMIERYGDSTRMFYRNVELSLDILYPIIYTFAFGLLISWLFQRGFKPDHKIQKWNVVPVFAWFFDLLENVGIVTLLSVWPSQPVALAWVTAILTMVKWFFAFLSFGLIFLGLFRAAMNGFKKQA